MTPAFRIRSSGSRRILNVEVVACAMLLVVVVAGLSFEVSVLARAPGVVVPAEASRPVHAVREGVVSRFLVAEGQSVRAGQPVALIRNVELEGDISETELSRDDLWLRALAFRALLGGHDAAWFDEAAGDLAAHPDAARYTAFVGGETALRRNRLREFDVALARYDAERDAHAQEMERTDELLAEIDKQRRVIAELIKRGAAAEIATHEIEVEYLTRAARKAQLKAEATVLASERARSQAERGTYLSDWERTLRDGLVRASFEAETATARLEALRAAQAELELRAPIDGVVQEVAVDVLQQPAGVDPLLTVVPNDGRVQVEARIRNSDIGSVRPGDAASLMVEAYSVIRHGTLDARVVTITEDVARGASVPLPVTITDPRQLPRDVADTQVAPSYVALLSVENDPRGTIELRPGLSVLVSIETSKRRILDFFLDPILRAWRSALTQR